MNCSVVIIDNQTARRGVCIVDDDMLPSCFFINNHISISFADLAFNTRFTYAKVLLFVYRYFVSHSIDLVERVASGTFLSRQEYEDFKYHCKYKVESEFESDSNVVSFERFSDKQLDNLIHSTQSSLSRASANTVKMRLDQFSRYIQYLYDVYHDGNFPPTSLVNSFVDLKRKVKSDINMQKDQNWDVRDPFEKAIPDSIYFKMLEIIKPDSTENPWKGSKLRNQLIVNIFIETGIREGALAKLKCSDIKEDWHNPRLLITRTPNDPTDKRKKQAFQKTKNHSSAISIETLEKLKLYMETDRKIGDKSNSHDFVFVSEKGKSRGQPLSLASIYKIIQRLSEQLSFKLYPHLFRHKWNEIFDDKAKEAGFTLEQIEDIRKYAMGWSENSRMGCLYNEYKYAMTVHELSAKRQKETIPQNEEIKNDNN